MRYETNQRLELNDRAAELAEKFNACSAETVLETLFRDVFPGRVGIVSSFGAESGVTLHMASRIDPYIPVIFLDTRKHFPETISYRDELVEKLGLGNLQLVSPRSAVLEAEDPQGDLHASEPDRCCHVRKTIPMIQALRGIDCWITGRKRGQTAIRAALQLFEVQDRWIKVNPLFDWTAQEVQEYYHHHNLPPHPLVSHGFRSIGCAPCTRAVGKGEDARAGRWENSAKTECGIHFEKGKLVRG